MEISAGEGTNQLVTAILLGSHALEMDRLPYRQALSQALAQGMADSGTVPDQTVDQITERYHTCWALKVAGPRCSMTG